MIKYPRILLWRKQAVAHKMYCLCLCFLSQADFRYTKKLTGIRKHRGVFKHTCAWDLLKGSLQKAHTSCSQTWIGSCLLPPAQLRACTCGCWVLLDPHLGCSPRGSSRNSWFMRVIYNRQAIPAELGMCDGWIEVVEELCKKGRYSSLKCRKIFFSKHS